MGLIAAWRALLSVDNKEWKQGFEGAREEVKKTDQTYKGFLKSLKGGLGKGSALGQTLKLMAGGGAIAGASLATREFAAFGESIEAAVNGTRDGTVSNREYYNSLAFGIPILGNVAKGIYSIQEAFSGQKAAQKEADAAWAKHVDAIRKANDVEREAARVTQDSTRAFLESARVRARGAEAAGLKGPAKDAATENARFSDQVKADRDKLAKDLNDAGVGPEELAGLKQDTDFYKKKMDRRGEIIDAARIAERQGLREHEATLAQIQLDANDEVHKQVIEQDKNAAANLRRMVIRNAEDERDALKGLIDETPKAEAYRSTQTAALRGGGTVQRFDPITNPMQETAKQQLAVLKAMDAHIQELKRGEESDQTVQVSF